MALDGSGIFFVQQRGKSSEDNKQGRNDQDKGEHQTHDLQGVGTPSGHAASADTGTGAAGTFVTEGTALIGDRVVLTALFAADHIITASGFLVCSHKWVPPVVSVEYRICLIRHEKL